MKLTYHHTSLNELSLQVTLDSIYQCSSLTQLNFREYYHNGLVELSLFFSGVDLLKLIKVRGHYSLYVHLS